MLNKALTIRMQHIKKILIIMDIIIHHNSNTIITISTITHTGKVVVNCSTTVVGASNDSKSFYYHNSVNGSNKTLSEGTTYVLDCNTGDYLFIFGDKIAT